MTRTVVELLQPYPLLFLLLGAGIADLWRCRRESTRRLLLVTVPFVALTALSLPAFAHLSLGALEWGYPPNRGRPADALAIVVLGGGIDPADATRLQAEMSTSTLKRACTPQRSTSRADAVRSSCPVVGPIPGRTPRRSPGSCATFSAIGGSTRPT